MKILSFRRMKKIMCNGDYFVMYALFNFEPVNGFKLGRNVGKLEVWVTAQASAF